MNNLAKIQNDTPQKCINGQFFQKGYSPEMYEILGREAGLVTTNV
jgi:hypothetical protein